MGVYWELFGSILGIIWEYTGNCLGVVSWERKESVNFHQLASLFSPLWPSSVLFATYQYSISKPSSLSNGYSYVLFYR